MKLESWNFQKYKILISCIYNKNFSPLGRIKLWKISITIYPQLLWNTLYTLWDRFEVEGDITLEEFIHYFKVINYGIFHYWNFGHIYRNNINWFQQLYMYVNIWSICNIFSIGRRDRTIWNESTKFYTTFIDFYNISFYFEEFQTFMRESPKR